MAARRACAAALAAMLLAGAPSMAQDLQLRQSPVLVIDPDVMLIQSRLGQRLTGEVDSQRAALATENRQIEAELNTEEQALTEERASLAPAEFRRKADAFDEKVQRIRREQDDKERAIAREADALRREFLTAANPIFAELLQRRGAVAILERRSVFVFSDSIDVTEEAIRLIDATLEPAPAPD